MPPQDTPAGAVAVLGARGFIGRTLTAALERAGVPVVARGSQTPAVRDGSDPCGRDITMAGRSGPQHPCRHWADYGADYGADDGPITGPTTGPEVLTG